MADTVAIENAHIGSRNFSGRPSKYNKDGNKDFVVFLDHDQAVQMQEDGWNIRWLDPRNPEDSPVGTLRVAVSYRNIPPKIMMVTSRNKMLLGEDDVSILDTADIQNVDIIIRPYNWSVNGGSGIKAYLKSMYVTIQEDEFAAKYDDIPLV